MHFFTHVLENFLGMYTSYREPGLYSLSSLSAYLCVFVCAVHVSESVSIGVEAHFHVLTRF